jgi:hypothetical protein
MARNEGCDRSFLLLESLRLMGKQNNYGKMNNFIFHL